MSTYYYYSDTLYHHGVKGQKWGLRRYQNEDGSLTSEGRQHYGYGEARANMRAAKAQYKADQKAYGKAFNRATGAGQYIRGLTKKGREENERRYSELVKTANKASESEAAYKQAKKEYKNSDEYKARQEKMKKAAIAGAAVVATALAAYGAYKIYSNNKKINDAKKVGEEYYGRLKSKASDMTWTAMHYGSGEEYAKARDNWKGTQSQLTKYRKLSSLSMKDANKRNSDKRKSESLAKTSDFQFNLAKRYDDVKSKYSGGYGRPNGEGAYRLSQFQKYNSKANEYFAKANANSGKAFYYSERSKRKRR